MSASVVMRLTSLARRNSQVAHPDLSGSSRFSTDGRSTPHASRLSGLAGIQRTSDNPNLRAGFEIGRPGRGMSDLRIQRISEHEFRRLVGRVPDDIGRPNRREVEIPGPDIPAFFKAVAGEKLCVAANHI